MSEITEALDSFERHAAGMEAVLRIRDALRQIGDLDAALASTQALLTKRQLDLTDVTVEISAKTAEKVTLEQDLKRVAADIEAANKAKESAESEARAMASAAHAAAAAEILESANKQAAEIVSKAEKSAREASSAAMNRLDRVIKQVDAKGAELSKINAEVQAAQSILDGINKAIADARAAVLGATA